jgi:hypothetical protein
MDDVSMKNRWRLRLTALLACFGLIEACLNDWIKHNAPPRHYDAAIALRSICGDDAGVRGELLMDMLPISEVLRCEGLRVSLVDGGSAKVGDFRFARVEGRNALVSASAAYVRVDGQVLRAATCSGRFSVFFNLERVDLSSPNDCRLLVESIGGRFPEVLTLDGGVQVLVPEGPEWK